MLKYTDVYYVQTLVLERYKQSNCTWVKQVQWWQAAVHVLPSNLFVFHIQSVTRLYKLTSAYTEGNICMSDLPLTDEYF